MLNQELEKRLEGKDANGQFLESLSYILASPNGEFRHVFKHFKDQPEVRNRLAERIHPETGLMQPNYFQNRVRDEISTIEQYNQRKVKPLKSTFVLFQTENVEKAKEYIKANKQAGTSIIGISEGIVMAFLPCDLQTAEEVMKDYNAALVPYEQGMTAEQMEKTARQDLKIKTGIQASNLRLLIAEGIHRYDADQMIAKYLKLKDICEKL